MFQSVQFVEWRDDGAYRHPHNEDYHVVYEFLERRIYFHRLPFRFKDDIKCMTGSRWHGHLPGDGRMIWSVNDTPRNRLQLRYLEGENILAHFDQPVREHEFRPLFKQGKPMTLRPVQRDAANALLTYRVHGLGLEMRGGKTLTAQMAMEFGDADRWWWVGPKNTLASIKRELGWWDFPFDRIQVDFLTHEGLHTKLDMLKSDDELPRGVFFDESHKLKTATSRRTKAAQDLADAMRRHYGQENIYLSMLSGTPAPLTPIDWWSPCEILFPGFLKEGSPAALEKRLAFMEMKQHDDGKYMTRTGWRDDEAKCTHCGKLAHEQHIGHTYKASVNEVAKLYDRLQGLWTIKLVKDCVDLPEVQYERVHCPPSPTLLRAARAIAAQCTQASEAYIKLRELSDGFQYREEQQGTHNCKACNAGQLTVGFDGDVAILGKCSLCQGTGQAPKIVRVAKQIPCPKDQVLQDLLDECDERGRIVVYAGFTGSIDRCVSLCQKRGWDVVRCDGRGFTAFDQHNKQLVAEPMDYWDDPANRRVAFVAHPESGGVGLNLSAARVTLFYSNASKSDARTQACARTRAPDNHSVIVDALHLPTDERGLELLLEHRKLELMTMGDFLGDSLGIAA